MGDPGHIAIRTKRRLIGLVMLTGLACTAPALATGAPASSDSALRALSGSDSVQRPDPDGLHNLSWPERDQDPASRAAEGPLVRPDAADAADLTKALAAGNRTARQLTTPEEGAAGTIGGALLAIAGLVLIVGLLARLTRAR